MSEITSWLLNNIASKDKKDFSCYINNNENIIKCIAQKTGNASYEIINDTGKVITVALYYPGNVVTGRYQYNTSEKDPELKALRKAAECIPGVTFEEQSEPQRRIFKSPDGDDSWMEPWEKNPAPGQEEEAYISAQKHWEEIQSKKQQAQPQKPIQEQPVQQEPEVKEEEHQESEEVQEYRALGIQFDEEGFPIITTAEQFNSYEGDIPFENLKMPEEEMEKLFGTPKFTQVLNSPVHTQKYMEEYKKKQEQKAQEQNPVGADPFWANMRESDNKANERRVSQEELDRRQKEETEKQVQQVRAQKQAQGQPIGGFMNPPVDEGKYGGPVTPSGFTQGQIDTIKAFQKKYNCENNPQLFNKYVNSWNPKARGKQDLTPENATSFCEWCDNVGKFLG